VSSLPPIWRLSRGGHGPAPCADALPSDRTARPWPEEGGTFTNYLAEIWRHRHFWLSLVRMDLQSRYRRSVLGIGWSLLHPLATTVVLCIAFYKLFNVPVREYVPFLMAGLSWWGYVTGAISGGCQCFVQAEGYIRQHPVPMAIYPLRTALGAMIHFVIALVVVLVMTWCFKGFGNLAALPSVVIGLGILLVFGWAVGVVAGYVNTVFRDVQHLTDIAFQVLFYLTPVMYPPEVLARADMVGLLRYNPLAHLLKIVRDPLVCGQVPSLRAYGVAAAFTLLAVAVALPLLGRLQRKVVLYL
jgi:lipopolysaccharide transport system permease protein